MDAIGPTSVAAFAQDPLGSTAKAAKAGVQSAVGTSVLKKSLDIEKDMVATLMDGPKSMLDIKA